MKNWFLKWLQSTFSISSLNLITVLEEMNLDSLNWMSLCPWNSFPLLAYQNWNLLSFKFLLQSLWTTFYSITHPTSFLFSDSNSRQSLQCFAHRAEVASFWPKVWVLPTNVSCLAWAVFLNFGISCRHLKNGRADIRIQFWLVLEKPDLETTGHEILSGKILPSPLWLLCIIFLAPKDSWVSSPCGVHEC